MAATGSATVRERELYEFQRLARATIWRATEIATLRCMVKHDGEMRDIELGMKRLRSFNCPLERIEVLQVKRFNLIHNAFLEARRQLLRDLRQRCPKGAECWRRRAGG